eukprot:scaffold195829_cov37-Attheya_sp.AAC.1
MVADPAVMSPRLLSAHLLREEIDEGGDEDDHDSIEADADDDSSIKEEKPVDRDDRRNDKDNTMGFSSILQEAKIDASKENTGNLHHEPEATTHQQQHGQQGEPRSNDNRSTGNRDILRSQLSEHQLVELKSLIIEEFRRETDAAPPRPQDHAYKDEAVRGNRQSEKSVSSSGIDAFSDEEEAQNCVSRGNTGARPLETPLSPKKYVLRSQCSEHQDEAVRGARQSDTPVSSSGIDAFSDEEEAQNCLSRENAQAEDGIFVPMKDTFSLMFICNIKSLGMAYSVLFFALQVAILVLISVNILKYASDENPLNVPVGTSLDVVAAQ